MVRFLLVLLTAASVCMAQDMGVDIKGKARDKVRLESLSPSPDIPKPQTLSFSLDGGQGAANAEIVPLTPAQAAATLGETPAQGYGLPAIPTAPFFAHRLPHRMKDIQEWTFRVENDLGETVYETAGLGVPEGACAWDGMKDHVFALDPNRTYNSYFVLKSSAGAVETRAGEAGRFLAVRTQDGGNDVLKFGGRVYEQDKAVFNPEAKIYLDDLARMVYLYVPSTAAWRISLYEPSEPLRERRRALWAAQYPLAEIVTEKSTDGESLVVIQFPGLVLSGEPDLHGRPSPPIPGLESKKEWVRIRETEEILIVEMQHDRLFRAGSAAVRDESLPELTAALQRVRQTPPAKKVLLRSYTEQVHDRKREKAEDDPRLTILRSKVLFSLFTKERFLEK